MKFEEYIILAFRTHNHLGSRRKNLAHMGLGIASEYLEIEQTTKIVGADSLAEELGDVLWFTACAIKIVNAKHRENIDKHLGKHAKNAMKAFKMKNFNESCGDVVNTIKKHYAYGIPILDYDRFFQHVYLNWRLNRKKKCITTHSIIADLYTIIMCVHCICEVNNLNFSMVMEDNIAKLKKRYPKKGWSQFHAAERLDKNETTRD